MLRRIRQMLRQAVSAHRPAIAEAPASSAKAEQENFTTVADLIESDRARWEQAKAAAKGGPKLLMATNVTGFQHASLLESVIAAALTLRGAEVHFLICDKVLPGCLRAEGDNVPEPRLFAEYRLPDRICDACLSVGDSIIGPLGLATHRFSALLSPEDRAGCRRIADETPLEAVGRFRYDGLSIGEHAYAGALRYFARGDIDGIPEAEIVVRRYFEASLLTARAARALLDRHAFKAAIFHHGIYVPQGPMGEVCRAAGLPVVNWNPSYRKNTFIFSHGDTYHHTLMTEPVDSWKAMSWSPEMERDIMDYLDSRRHGGRDWIWFHEKPDEAFGAYAEKVGLDLGKPVIGLLTNVMWDAQLHYPANAFPNMLDWVLKTIAAFAKRPDLQLLIRIHPAEIRGTVPSKQPLAAEIAKAFPELPANVFVIPPESPVSTYAAMEACNAVIIYGTKTGVELTSYGKPVIVAGEAWIRNKGLTRDASTEEDYFRHLDALPAVGAMDSDTVREARKYAYHFFFRRMVPLPFIVPKPGKIYQLSLPGLDDLRPGVHPGLDAICDGILHGRPFTYEAERHGLHDR